MSVLPYRILERKRAGMRLAEEEIRAVAEGAADGSWTEGQLGAFLMAAAIRGLDPQETRSLTLAMLESGERWDLFRDVPLLCDKHSTGGVGDKVSLVIGPLLASCGLPIAMLAGRGLGHTGGTIDKLESIPGMEMGLDRARCLDLLARRGLAIGGATSSIAPADQPPLLAARHHRHGRLDPPDHRQHPLEEARRRARRSWSSTSRRATAPSSPSSTARWSWPAAFRRRPAPSARPPPAW